MTHRFDPPFIPLPLAQVLAALVDTQHAPEDGVDPAVLDSALDHMRQRGASQAGRPTYEPKPGRWDVNDPATRGPDETEAAWAARCTAAAVYWAEEDRREREAAAAAYYANLSAQEKRRVQNREAQARYRARHKAPTPPEVAYADAEVERLVAQVRALQAALSVAQEQLRHARALRAARVAAHAATLSNPGPAAGP